MVLRLAPSKVANAGSVSATEPARDGAEREGESNKAAASRGEGGTNSNVDDRLNSRFDVGWFKTESLSSIFFNSVSPVFRLPFLF